MKILGIDPGLSFTGYAILKKENGKTFLLKCDVLKLNPTKSLPERIKTFHDFFENIIKDFSISDVSIETPFLGKNAQNFLKLGYLRGILYLLVNKYGLRIHEYSPREVKQAVTGFGGASKDQVARVMHQFFPGIKSGAKLDMTDALAVSLCGLWKNKTFL